MVILVGSGREDAFRKANDWFSAPVNQQLLEDLLDWAEAQEAVWGQAVAFVEPDVPRIDGLRTRNVDFVLGFDDRAVVCEVKSDPYGSFDKARARLGESLRQCAASFELVQSHLRRSVPPKAIAGFIFYPHFDAAQVALLRQQQGLWSYPHLTICGGYRCQADPDSYLLAVFKSKLQSRPTFDPKVHKRDANQVLLRQLYVPGVVRQYTTLGSAVSDLRLLCRVPRSFLLNERHVRGFWPVQQSQLRHAMEQHGFAEVVGAAGIGKSAFIGEFLEWLEEQGDRELSVIAVSCRPGMTSGDIVRSCLEGLSQDTQRWPTDDIALRRLCDFDSVFWLTNQRHSGQAADAISELITALPGIPPGRRAKFVIESVVPTVPIVEARVGIEALTESQIYRILDERPAGHAEHDKNQIAFWARGNPKLAIARWGSPKLDSPPTSSTGSFDWIQYAFEGIEPLVLKSIAVVLSEAPLGLTLDLLIAITPKLHSGLVPDTVIAAVQSVVDKLEAAQLVHVYRFQSDLVGPLAQGIGRRQFADINNLDVSLSASLRSAVPDHQAQEWQTEATTILMNYVGPEDSLAKVTAALRLGDLWPFCKSSFRHTHRGSLIAWLNTKSAEGSSWRRTTTDAYLERAIRIQHRMFQYPLEPVNLEVALGKPADGSVEQQYMWQALSGKSNCYLLDGECDVTQWERDIESVSDPDLAAQSAASLAKALQVAQRPEDAWRILADLLDRLESFTPATKGIVLFHALAFLNRTANTRFVGLFADKSRRQTEIEKYARLALLLALDLENITYLASSVFFYIRSLESIDPPQSEDDLSGYLAALQFVERASPVRTLQALLTQGSLHRNYCFQSQVTLSWEDFVTHADEAFTCYRRAFHTAVNSRSTTHQLTATSYCGELCLGCLPHARTSNDRAYIVAKVDTTLEMYEYVRKHYPTRVDVGGDGHIWDTLAHTYPFLRMLVLDSQSQALAYEVVGQELSDALKARWTWVQTQKRWDRPRPIGELLKNATRVLEYVTAEGDSSLLRAACGPPALTSSTS